MQKPSKRKAAAAKARLVYRAPNAGTALVRVAASGMAKGRATTGPIRGDIDRAYASNYRGEARLRREHAAVVTAKSLGNI